MVSAPGGGVRRRRRLGPIFMALAPNDRRRRPTACPGMVSGVTATADGTTKIKIW